MKENNLVSVIITCFNNEAHIEECIQSVLNQSYSNVEILITDDYSSDNSFEVINKYKSKATYLVKNKQNIGLCKSFNNAFKQSNGIFIIDLAADDWLTSNAIENLVNKANAHPNSIIFSNCNLIYPHLTQPFYPTNYQPKEGFIYTQLLEKFIIHSATQLIPRSILNHIGGYDETLLYEDFDFWIRTGKKYTYYYCDHITINKRIREESLATEQVVIKSKSQFSTLEVCKKAYNINENVEDDMALVKRIDYEIIKSARSGNWQLVKDYYQLSLNVVKRSNLKLPFKTKMINLITRVIG